MRYALIILLSAIILSACDDINWKETGHSWCRHDKHCDDSSEATTPIDRHYRQ